MTRRSLSVVLLGSILLMSSPLCAIGAPEQVREYVLDNGLKLLVKPDHRAPVVVSQVWYRVGSSYEHGGITGISHMLEHMMFKGTETLAPGEFSRIIAANGGTDNAFTGRDYTAYYQKLESSRLGLSFRLEADRMANLQLLADEFSKERDVVTEERRLRTEDRPQSLAYEQFMAAAFQASPYRHPVIGWMDDIRAYELADLERWHRRWYGPNNAIVVVVGDVDPEEVRALAEKHFGSLEPVSVEPPKPRTEPAQAGPRRLSIQLPAKLPSFMKGFKVPSIATAQEAWEPYALTVLAAVLDGDSSARFSRELIRGEAIAVSAGVDYDLYARLGTLFTVSGVPAGNRTVAELEAALDAQLSGLRDELITPEELARIQTRVVAGDIYQRDSVFYQAMRLGMLETIGVGWRLADEYVERIRAVTPEQVRAVARKYLIDGRSTTAVLEPQSLESATGAGGAKGDEA